MTTRLRLARATPSRTTLTVLAAFLAAGIVLAGASAARTSGSPATATKKLTIYSVATAVQYLNNADDETRGASNNPFDAATSKLKPKLSGKGDGPFAGDVTVYSFRLYGSAKLGRTIGTASYTCYYNYNKKALCDADYELANGSSTLVASGPIDFDTTRYALIVTGGTSKYVGVRGELIESPVVKRSAQRLDFVFVG